MKGAYLGHVSNLCSFGEMRGAFVRGDIVRGSGRASIRGGGAVVRGRMSGHRCNQPLPNLVNL